MADTPRGCAGAGVSLPSRRGREDDACHGARRTGADEAFPAATSVPGETVAVRDRVVLWVLVVGIGAGVLAWAPLGPWAGLLPMLAALLVASLVYRVEPPRIDLDAPLSPLTPEEAAVAPSGADQ